MKSIIWLAIAAMFLLWACGDETEPKPDTDTATDDTAVTDDTTADDQSDPTDQTDQSDQTVTDDTVTDDTVADDTVTDDTVTDDTTPDETPDTDGTGCTLGIAYSKNGLNDIATGITLDVFSNGWGTFLETIPMDSEGTVTLQVPEDDPYNGDTPAYFIYEMADGFFTEYAYAVFGDTITVDLDPAMPDHVNGNIFMVQSYFGPTALANTTITVSHANGTEIGCFTTDGDGRFVIDLPAGGYQFAFTDMDSSVYDEYVETTGPGDYLDLRFMAQAQVDKPNIYLYPLETTDVSVTLGFPQGGAVLVSIPEYGDGWQVTVTPDGIIDGQYDYLFYEAQQPDGYQYTEGWTVAAGELEPFFRSNLTAYGFIGREIEDFIAWWIPRLTGSPCYDIYPQTSVEIAPLITLDIVPAPDSLQRLFYAVRATDDCVEHLDAPAIAPFFREGFAALEWGIVLK